MVNSVFFNYPTLDIVDNITANIVIDEKIIDATMLKFDKRCNK